MSNTKIDTENSKKSPVQWPSQPLPDKDVHINCGTTECCGECITEEAKEK